MWEAAALPQRRVEDARVGGVHRQVGRAGTVGDVLAGIFITLFSMYFMLAQGPRIRGLRQEIAAFPSDVIAASSFPLMHMFDALAAAESVAQQAARGSPQPTDVAAE